MYYKDFESQYLINVLSRIVVWMENYRPKNPQIVIKQQLPPIIIRIYYDGFNE